MVVKNLAPGSYIVTFSNPGYDALRAEILVSDSGISCTRVEGGACGSTVAPGINITGLWSAFATLLPSAAPPTPTPPAPEKGYLSITSSPSAASAFVDGTPIGTTPITRYELDPGTVNVLLSLSGYEAITEVATVVSGEVSSLALTLLPIAPASVGYLTISSVPSGASVVVDGATIGTTPITSYGLAAGSKLVTLSKEGYTTKEQSVTVAAGETAVVSVTLEEAVAPPTPAPGEGICGWIDEIGVGSLTRLHWLYAYYLTIGATDLADINYPNLVPKPSPMTMELSTRENWLALYYYSIGATDLGNLNTGCNY